MHRKRNFLSFLILATAASSVWGQVLAPTETSAQGAASVAGSDTLYAPVTTSGGRGGAEATSSIPDFSGIWARLSFWGFEPPLAGPGPVVNRLRAPNGASSLFGQVGDYSNPILKPQAAEIVKKHGETESSGELAPNPRNMCWPGGVPFVFTNVGMQMIQQADRVMIFYADDHEVRQVRLNQRHPAQVTPSWYGDSVGHYEGDTLVIDTVGVKTDRPLAMVDVYGTPFTQALHVVERYQLLDYEAAKRAEEWGERENFATQQTDQGFARDLDYKGKGLQLHFTVEDEGVFTTPWTATVTYRRPLTAFGQWPEVVCAQNAQRYGKKAAVPSASNPDF